jgi:hypothetical protein
MPLKVEDCSLTRHLQSTMARNSTMNETNIGRLIRCRKMHEARIFGKILRLAVVRVSDVSAKQIPNASSIRSVPPPNYLPDVARATSDHVPAVSLGDLSRLT